MNNIYLKKKIGQFNKMAKTQSDFVLLSGNSHPDLAQKIADRIGVKLANCSLYHSSNRESRVDIGDSVRARDCYIIQTAFGKELNNQIMELMIMAYCCKTSSAKNIVAVLPYMPYSKQSKMRKRGCIVSKLLAKMMVKSGLTHIITIDLHAKEIQGFFDCPIDNLRASPFLLQYIQESIPDYRNATLVAIDDVKRATSYAERLRLPIAVLHGKFNDSENDSDQIDGRCSPPINSQNSSTSQNSNVILSSREYDAGLNEIPVLRAKEKQPLRVIGDISGKIAIIIDDMIDDVRHFIAAADILKQYGAYRVYVLSTHGLLSSDSPRLIEDSQIDEVVVTNTVPHEVQKLQCSKIKTIDISILLAEAIRRIHNKESMSALFKNVTLED